MKLSAASAFLLTSLCLTGCTAFHNSASANPSVITGHAFGGRQPISGAHIYMLEANTSAYGGPGIAASTANKSVSMLESISSGPFPTTADGNGGYYVTTAADGSFSITNEYNNCTQGDPVYLYSVGGDAGAGPNSAAGLLAILGNCPNGGSFSSSTTVNMNEVSTIAAAYAMAGFASDATHVGSSGSALAQTGMANAFASAALLFDTTSNPDNTPNTPARLATPSGNGVVPQQQIDTLANILSACVNTSGPTSPQCSTLFSGVESGGATGTPATDTATAAIYMAHNPALTSVYSITGSGPNPYTPWFSTAAPADFTIAISYTGGGIDEPFGSAADAQGNLWIADFGNRLIELSAGTGAAASPSAGYTGGGIDLPDSLAIDSTGNIWVGDDLGSVISEFYGATPPLGKTTGSPVFPSGDSNGPTSYVTNLAFDQNGYLWIASYGNASVVELDSTGAKLGSYTATPLVGPEGIAIDTGGYVWASDIEDNLVELYGSKPPMGASTGAVVGNYTGGGLNYDAEYTAIDPNGYVWVASARDGTVALFHGSNAAVPYTPGEAVTGSTGFTSGFAGASALAIDSAGRAWVAVGNPYQIIELCGTTAFYNCTTGSLLTGATGFTGGGTIVDPASITIDGSGNLWSAQVTGTVVELIGVASPVATPLVANLLAPYGTATANRP